MKVVEAIRGHCLAKEGAVEEHPWDHVAFKVRGRIFVIGDEDASRLTIKSSPDRQAALVLHPNIEVAAYVGRFGWVSVEVVDSDVLALALDLIDEAYDSIAIKKRPAASRVRSGTRR